MKSSMYNAYKKVFWGIFIATFNINLGIIPILPTFIGFMIISSGISTLYDKTNIEAFKKAKVFANIVVLLTAAGQFIEFIYMNSVNSSILIQVLIMSYSVIELILFFKFFEGTIEYFKSNNNKELADENVEKLRFYIVVSIINIIVLNFSLIFHLHTLNIIVAIILIILRIYIMVQTNEFKKMFLEKEV